MPTGPILIFDKSALQCLNRDEAVLLDHFFMTSITPLFFIETLADLEKAVKAGRTPEQEVGSLASKTPDMQSSPTVHHRTLLAAELSGAQKIVMDGKLYRAGGKTVNLDGQKGVMFVRTEEEEAFDRWGKHEFLELERQIAKAWRKNLSNIDYSATYQYFQKYYKHGKPKELSEVKPFAERVIDETDPEKSLVFGLRLFGFSEDAKDAVMQRWHAEGKPAIRAFAPYFHYIYSVDLFFYLAIAADLISRVRPADKADNKVDIAYLYYLPFCMVFTSSDNLHERVVPLFLRDDQSFVKGQDLKADIRKLDELYSALPEKVQSKGLSHFASDPPDDTSFLVTQLWDKHLPAWRKRKAEHKEPSKELQQALVDLINRIDKDSQSSDPRERVTIDETDFIQIKRQVHREKGKWVRFGPEAEKASV
jgi:hypothetical protein